MVVKHTLTGTIEDAGGPAGGEIVLKPSARVRHSADQIFLEKVDHRVDLVDGEFSIELYDTSDAGWDVADWKWECTIRIIDGTSTSLSFSMTSDQDLSAISLA